MSGMITWTPPGLITCAEQTRLLVLHGMRHVIALMLVFIFMMSHGSMSSAAPHADHHDAHGEMAPGDHSHPLPLDSDEPDSDVGHATHVHVVVTLPELQAIDIAPPVEGSQTVRPRGAAELATRGVAPLLEPPSA